jgi:putative transposase
MGISALVIALAQLRIFATTLYYGSSLLNDSPGDDEQALEKYALIAPCIEDGVSQRDRAKEKEVSERTIRRLITKFKALGLDGLKRKRRSDKGAPKVSDNSTKFIKGRILEFPELSCTVIHRQLNRLSNHSAEYKATYNQIRYIKKSLSEDMVVLARSEKEFEETREILFRHEAVYPNEVWQCDHKFLDILVWDSCRNAVQPVLTAIIDDYSRAIMGYYLDLDPPSAQRTALTLRQAIWHKKDPLWLVCGIPDRFYSDRGTDFKSHRIENIAAELSIKLSKGRPYKPQGKGKIERFFESVNQLLMSELPGFTPEYSSPTEPGMTIQQLQATFQEWLIAEYMHRLHSEIGQTPFERWSSHASHPRLADSLETLNVLLLTVPDERIVQQDGIRIFKLRYYATEFSGLIGKRVTARYDPQDISYVLIYLDNEYICRAICAELADQKPGLKEFMKARASYKRGLKQDIDVFVSFANSQPEALRKIPAVVSTDHSDKKLPVSKLRRYRVDE